MKNSFLLFLLISITFSCMRPVPRKPITRKTSSFFQESVEFNKKLNKEEEAYIEQVIAKDSVHNFKISSEGFWVAYTSEKKIGTTAKFGEIVTYKYQVENLKDKVLYSFEDIGEKKYAIDQQEIEEGLRNALKLLKEGEEAVFLFPSHKMYGYSGDQNKVGINQPLKIKVQLIKIDKRNESN